ncbi:amino acid adenylation domain-containing protein [Azospirillum melinis]|uniref:Amino acid adenylation domain-containing protein n=1 Tax=Azospirillum melinis TaxID=328839 RepID=A0ABX2KDZ8_9PROT|nr:non-ribosomal peptide synthetase [Azospirillum melinis]MBP2308073.1 amino acid adenylation domain-containing protein [Azospirillum melinis]NUA99992.1 amino acid adenylation domain-containing protein [Azospirillum melinis]
MLVSLNRVSLDQVERSAPLSLAQERLWLLHRLDPGDAAYNLTRAFRLAGALEAAALERALEALAWRHSILRTRFAERDGGPVQLVLSRPAVRLEWEVGDLDEAGLAGRIRAETQRPFDLAAGPPLRATLLTLAGGDAVLLLAMHHILSDGPSNPILARDLLAAYGAAVADEEADPATLLPPLALHYADHALEQRGAAAQARIDRAVERALARLGTDVPAMELPTDRPRPAVRGNGGARLEFALPADMAAALRAFSRAEGCTPFVPLLAAWQALLGRWSGQGDFAVGVPDAGRADEALEPLVGFFVETQVFRARLAPDLTGRALCRRLRGEMLAALNDGAAPVERLLERLDPVRDGSRTPLFQTLLNVRMEAPAVVRLPGLTVTALPVPETTAKLDLALDVAVGEAGVVCALDYATDLFDTATAERMAVGFRALLGGMMADPERLLADLPLMAAAERADEVTRWNRTALPLNPAEDLVAMVERKAAELPDCVALVAGNAALTYGALNARANRLARWLAERGVGPDRLVAVALPRGADLVVSLLAIQKAGGAYLPLDPDQPAARNAHILAHAAPVLPLDAPPEEFAVGFEALPDGNLGRPAHPRQLAYTLYTSGSTGVPKGVQIDRQAFASFLHAMQKQIGLTADDRLLAVTTLGFDIAGLELFLPLATGARVVLATREEARDPQALAGLIERHGVTAMQATPATWRMLLEATAAHWTGLRALCGGEALGAELARRLLERGVRLLNVYGPTETTVWSAAWPVEGVADVEATIPIGHAIANNRLHILDGRLEPVPPGVVGDLWIGGIGLARGYGGQPGLTAASFLPNPFPDDEAPGCGAGSRLYRTGDRARRRNDGAIEFLSRRDHQMKIRGFRIEAGEVEAALDSHPQVRQSVVTAHVPAGGEALLCAYLVTADGSEPADLQAHLAARLPAYMLPSVCVVLDRLPLNANGKVDRKALPTPDAPARSTGFEPPATDTEIRLAVLWDEVLERRGPGLTLGATDDFFRLGGHSLRLVRLQTRIRSGFGHDLPLADLFRAPTLRAMAALIDAQGVRDEADDLAFMAGLLADVEKDNAGQAGAP